MVEKRAMPRKKIETVPPEALPPRPPLTLADRLAAMVRGRIRFPRELYEKGL